MRGDFPHNFSTDQIARCLRASGCDVIIEAPIHGDLNRLVGFADILASLGGMRLVVEVENTTKQFERDLLKVRAAQASELWIVTPNPRVASCFRKRLRTKSLANAFLVRVMTIPQVKCPEFGGQRILLVRYSVL